MDGNITKTNLYFDWFKKIIQPHLYLYACGDGVRYMDGIILMGQEFYVSEGIIFL